MQPTIADQEQKIRSKHPQQANCKNIISFIDCFRSYPPVKQHRITLAMQKSPRRYQQNEHSCRFHTTASRRRRSTDTH